MKITAIPYYLEFTRPFALAHGSRNGTDLVFVKLELEDITGYGEASLPPYRKETSKSVVAFIEQHSRELDSKIFKNPFENASLIPFNSIEPAASHALQTSIFDWFAQKQKQPLHHYFKQEKKSPFLTLTITKNDFDFLEEKLKLERHFTHFKLKLTGKDDDLEFVKAIRKRTDIPFCIDCNQGYSKKEDAIQLAASLEKLQVSLLEQPLKDIDHDAHYWLKQRTELPVVADESICSLEDLQNFGDAYSGVNVKLIKCGGLINAQKMLELAANKKMMKLIGCMSESSLGVAAASILTSQCDFADLDAPYLNKNNPFTGFEILNGKIEIEGEYGIGVRPIKPI